MRTRVSALSKENRLIYTEMKLQERMRKRGNGMLIKCTADGRTFKTVYSAAKAYGLTEKEINHSIYKRDMIDNHNGRKVLFTKVAETEVAESAT